MTPRDSRQAKYLSRCSQQSWRWVRVGAAAGAAVSGILEMDVMAVVVVEEYLVALEPVEVEVVEPQRLVERE